MMLVTVKSRFQVTIPSQLRESARLREGDILEATLVEGGILLRPKALVDRDAVADAMETLMESAPAMEDDRGKSEDDIMSEAIVEVARTRSSRHKPTS